MSKQLDAPSRRRLLCGVAAGVIAIGGHSPSASAQSADDLVVMRRVIAPANGRTPIAVTPTPVTATWIDRDADWAWAPGASTCSARSSQIRTVRCERGGEVVSDAQCTGRKPDEQRDVARFTDCTFRWTTGEYRGVVPTCDAAGTRYRTVSCMRSDDTAATDDTLCTETKPVTQNAAAFEGCTYAWTTTPTPSCSVSAPQNVQCLRSNGGGAVVESFCVSNAGTRPSNTAVNTERCEQIPSSTMDSSDGYYGVMGTTFSNGIASMTATTGSIAQILYNAQVTNGATYTISIDWKGTSAAGVCSMTPRGSLAVWRYPNGTSKPVQGGFVYDTYQICGGQSAKRTFSFQADYTGVAQIVVYLEASPSPGKITAQVDNLSLRKAPQ